MKKAAAALLAVLVVAGTPISVYADEAKTATSSVTTEAKALESVIKSVKSRVTIPAELNKFEYDTDSKYGVTFYKLKWYKEEKVQRSWGEDTVVTKSITVKCHKNIITSVDVYDRNRTNRTGFAKLTDQQAESFAKKYVKDIYPDLKGEPVFERVQSTNALRSSDIRYNITRPVSGIDFDENGGTVVIDKDTGALVKYEMVWWNDAVFPDASKRLTVDQVSQIYKQSKPLEAKYKLFSTWEYNDETGDYDYRQFVLPVYTPTVYGKNEIDAITGKETAIYDDMEKYSYTDAYEWDTDDDDEDMYEEACEEEAAEDNGGLTEAELAAVMDENKYMSYEKCLEKIKKDEFIVFNKELVNSSNYVSSYTDIKGNEQPLRVLEFEFTSSDETKDSIELTVRMDAVTGEFISFRKEYEYGSKSKNANTKPADDDAVLARANAAAKHFMGKKADEYKADKAPYVYKTKSYTDIEGNVGYTRYVNGLSADFDDIDITVDSRGEVLSFSYSYHDIEFPKPDLVGEDAAYEKLFEHMKPDLYYTGFSDLQLKPHMYLTYRFDSSFMINALTGDRINEYDASIYYKAQKPEKKEKVIAYTDIKGYKYEKEIQTLLDYGIYVTDSDKLAPDELITNGEFAALFGNICSNNISGLYPDRYDSIKKEYVPHKDRDKKLTHAELAKIYVRLFANEYSEAAEVPGIYKAPFTDVNANDPYCGWIVFAKADGLVKGKNGKFSPNEGLTKGEALKIVYDYLAQSKSDKKLYQIVEI